MRLRRAREAERRARAELDRLRAEVDTLRARVDLDEAILRAQGVPLDLPDPPAFPGQCGNLVRIEAARAARRRRWRVLPGAAIIAVAGRALSGHPLRAGTGLAVAAASVTAIALSPAISVFPHGGAPGSHPSPGAYTRVSGRRVARMPANRKMVQAYRTEQGAPESRPGSQLTAPAGLPPAPSPSPAGVLKRIVHRLLPSPSPSSSPSPSQGTCVVILGIRTCVPLSPLGFVT